MSATPIPRSMALAFFGEFDVSIIDEMPIGRKPVITKVISEKQEPLLQEEIVKQVLAQRLVAKNTVMINLNNKKYFTRNQEGKYSLPGTQVA